MRLLLRSTMLAVGLAAALWATSARAGTIATSTLYRGTSQASIFCVATNVGTSDASGVVSELVGTDGAILATSSCSTLAPGAVCQASTAPGPAMCRIRFNGSARSIRGAGSVSSATGNNIQVVEPAR